MPDIMSQAELAHAIARYQAGAFAEAAAAFAALRAEDAADATLLRLHGLALARAGEPVAALPLLARARRLDFAEPLAHLHYGIALLAAGRPARAAAAFRRATTLAPDSAAPWTNFAAALIALDRPAAARAAARRALQRAPGDADALYMLGRAEAAAGNHEGARDAFHAATRARPAFADAWVEFGLANYRLGAAAVAMAAMQSALRADPAHNAAAANLAAFELLRGETEAALARLAAVLAREPGCVAARLNRANAHLLDHEAAAALALLEGAPPPGRDGAHWRAHRALALLLLHRTAEARAELAAIGDPHDAEILVLWRRILLAQRDGDPTEAAALAARMAALAADPQAALLEHRIIAEFELARFHDAHDRIATAFAHWHRGHRLLAPLQPFSRAAHAAFVADSIAAFDAPRLRAGPRAAVVDDAPVFVVGMPRSGTTLTEQILASHPQVHGAGERPAMHALIRRLAPGRDAAATARALAALDAPTLTAEARAFLGELHALAPGARRIVDKMPDNARWLGFIRSLLPGARIIHCVRDPRDIGLSIYQLRFFGFHPYAHDLGDLGWAIRQHARLMAHWRGVMPILEVALRDWIEDFPATLARVLAFLDLPHDAACEAFHRQDRRVRTASAAQVREPLNARGIGRWRRYAAELGPLLAELEADGGGA
jgi:tetratricopeptide (TPR) repeat protein